LLTVPILVLRFLDEERMLASDLDGYTTYMHTVRYRLVPGLW
jgi:protein-S-isoprenylcysteine O-methyltransferase Ste14